ncbi:MAG: hypothetical protein HQ512_08855 [Rhodospirillales bacterium]|nr:hypothetical protein [Rhodospirillales bacterium]
MKLPNILTPKPFEKAARKIYISLVEQARQPGFYLFCGVPDTPDGRFDMIMLHAFLVLRRLKRDHDRTADLGQAVFDLMFADMDQNLREMGIGDIGVGLRIKAMASAFYGRISVYDEGLDGAQGKLSEALRRNLFRKTEPDSTQVSTIADYMGREAKRLDKLNVEDLIDGKVVFGPAPDVNEPETEEGNNG